MAAGTLAATTSTPTDDAHAPRPVRRSSWSSRVLVNTVLVMVAFYTLMPLSWLLVNATKDNGDLFGSPGFRLGDFSLFTNIADLFSYDDGVFGR